MVALVDPSPSPSEERPTKKRPVQNIGCGGLDAGEQQRKRCLDWLIGCVIVAADCGSDGSWRPPWRGSKGEI